MKAASTIVVTPGMCALVENLAPEILREKWDSFMSEVFNKEETPIYGRAMITCATIRSTNINLVAGRKLFKDMLTADQVKFQYDLVPDFILNYYWSISKLDAFWTPAFGFGNHAPFKKAMEVWQQNRAEDIEYCRRGIETWVQ